MAAQTFAGIVIIHSLLFIRRWNRITATQFECHTQHYYDVSGPFSHSLPLALAAVVDVNFCCCTIIMFASIPYLIYGVRYTLFLPWMYDAKLDRALSQRKTKLLNFKSFGLKKLYVHTRYALSLYIFEQFSYILMSSEYIPQASLTIYSHVKHK